MYYEKRDRYNSLVARFSSCDNLEKAVLLIFLNKTCFNGLYRVNRKGMFNVPMGSYKRPIINDTENLRRVSKLLRNVTIVNGDFRDCISFIDEHTFVYIDPPYRPLTPTASFNSYTKAEFDDKEQIELGCFVDTIHNRGAKIVISNSDPKNVNEKDNFFDELYDGYEITRIPAKRMINSNAKLRGEINELLISNF
jgi:DNA adenine methylase